MTAKNRKVKVLNTTTQEFETGTIIKESVYRKTYTIQFDYGVKTIDKSLVQFI